MRSTRDAVVNLNRLIGDDAEMRRMIAERTVNLEIGQLVYDARTAAHLSQAWLARRIGVTESVISELEDADYRGNALFVLRRIADALRLRLEVRLIPRARSRE